MHGWGMNFLVSAKVKRCLLQCSFNLFSCTIAFDVTVVPYLPSHMTRKRKTLI